jgi:large subunit ribosomal protein L20
MPRAKRGFKARRRRKGILKQAKGFRGGNSKQFRQATERVNRALKFSYRDRRTKKRDFRSLWIARINAATKGLGVSYSRFMHGLKLLNIDLNRKVLSDLAIANPKDFTALVDKVREKMAA